MIKSISKYILLLLVGVLSILLYQTIKQGIRRANPNESIYNTIRTQCMIDKDAQIISLMTEDAIQLHGLYIERKTAKRKWLVVHGYRQAKECYVQLADLFPLDTFLFIDLRAHGASSGSIITYGYLESLDVATGYDFLKNKQPNLPIIGIGFSMGAASIAHAASKGLEFSSLILDSSFSNLQQQFDKSFERITGLPRCCNFLASCLYKLVTTYSPSDLDVGRFIEKTKMPILLLHSKCDTFTALDNIYAIKKQVPEDRVAVIVMNTGKHARLLQESPANYKKVVDEFLQYATI